MIWATWRQHRPETLAGLAALIATAALVLYTDASRGFLNGTPGDAQDLLLLLAVLPALVGVFIGAPLLARDIEQGTHRLVWTQGTPRARWLAIKLLLVFIAVAAGASLLGGCVSATIHAQHVVLQGGTVLDATDRWTWFDAQGPAFAAYVVFSLALGIAAGAVIGRTYPAMALTLVAFVAVRVAVEAFLRPHYVEPLRSQLVGLQSIQRPPGVHDPWYVAFVYRDAAGHTLSLNEVLHRMSGPTETANDLAAHGITGWVYYQPADRFWTFQGIEAAIFVALAALLVGLAAHWITRRTT